MLAVVSVSANAPSGGIPCGDPRLAGIEAMDGVTGAVPSFMISPLQAMCRNAALQAVAKLPAECADLSATLAHPELETCDEIGRVLSAGVANKHSCYCKAAVIMADAESDLGHKIFEITPNVNARSSVTSTMLADRRQSGAAAGVMAALPVVAIGAVAAAVARTYHRWSVGATDDGNAPLEIL